MYPIFRMFKEMFQHRNASQLSMTDTHVSHHICWPWDIDPWMELNNGRTLTLYDLGRIVWMKRLGMVHLAKDKGWGATVAGSSVRYRKRVRAFDRFDMRTRMVGWDARFFYVEQAMWRKGECTSHGLLRLAITDRNGLVQSEKVMAAIGDGQPSPALPDWVLAWIDAENKRPWPPMQDTPPLEIAA